MDVWEDLRGFFNSRASAAMSDADAAVAWKEASIENSDSLYQAIASDIDELLDLSPTDALLDIGCGPGALLKNLTSRVRCARGIDISPAMVEMARAKGLLVDLYEGQELPYEDATFEVVLIFYVILNISQRVLVQKILREALRVLKPGGRLLVGANFHSTISGLPVHDDPKGSSGWLSWLLRRNPIKVGTYATDYDIFAETMAQNPIVETRFVWQRNNYPGKENRAQGRYHVLIRKADVCDLRAMRP